MNFFIPTSDARAIKLAALLKPNEKTFGDSFEYITILPIPFTTDGVHLNKSDMKIEALYDRVAPGGLYIGYDLPRELSELIEKNGGVIIDVSKSESFLLKNAALTADGALGYILTHFNKAPRDMKIAIIGLGRIGNELLKLLLFMRSRVCVFTRTPTKGLMLAENTVDTRLVSYKDPDKVRHGFLGFDIVVNTAPQRLIGQSDLADLSGVSVIELASGENMPKELKHVRLMSIPATMYSDSGGRVYYEAAMENLLFLQENL